MMPSQRFGLIINPNARNIKKLYISTYLKFWQAFLAPEEFEVPESGGQVKAAVAKMLERGVTTLGIMGGDGSIQFVISELLKLNPSTIPDILPFRGGTINAACNNLGIRDMPDETLKKMINLSPAHRTYIYKNVIKLEESGADGSETRFGFSFAGGAVVAAFQEYYRSKEPGMGPAVRLILKLIAGGIFNISGGPAILRPVEMKVAVPGRFETEGKFRAVVASTLENPTLWWRPFGNELNGKSAFHYIVNSMPTRELAFNIWDLFLGRGQHPHHQMGQAASLKLSSDAGYILDGGLFGIGKKLDVDISIGPALRFLCL
jgi:hypothetical protein